MLPGSEIYDAFHDHAVVNGEEYIIYVPTASGSPYSTPEQIERAIADFESVSGLDIKSLVHTYDPDEANTVRWSYM